MAQSADPDWVEIERLVRETPMSLREIALRTGVSSRTLSYRSARQGWRPSEALGPRPTLRTRRTLILRFYRAIDKKLQQMESRMEKEIESGEGASTSADHERDARTIGGLINQLGKLSEYETVRLYEFSFAISRETLEFRVSLCPLPRQHSGWKSVMRRPIAHERMQARSHASSE